MSESRLEQLAVIINLATHELEEFEAKEKKERVEMIGALKKHKNASDISALQRYAAIGRDLLEAKKLCKAGTFEKWVSTNCKFGSSSSQRYMMLAKYVDDVGEYPKMSIQAFTEMMSATDEERAEINEIAERDGYISVNAIRKIRKKIVAAKKTDVRRAEKRLSDLVSSVKRSDFSKQELLIIRDQLEDFAKELTEFLLSK